MLQRGRPQKEGENELLLLEKSGHFSSTWTGLIVFAQIYITSFFFFLCYRGAIKSDIHQLLMQKLEQLGSDIQFKSEDGTVLNTDIRRFEDFTASDFQGEKVMSCGICFTNFEKTSVVASLMCDSRHIFHAECLLPWLE